MSRYKAIVTLLFLTSFGSISASFDRPPVDGMSIRRIKRVYDDLAQLPTEEQTLADVYRPREYTQREVVLSVLRRNFLTVILLISCLFTVLIIIFKSAHYSRTRI